MIFFAEKSKQFRKYVGMNFAQFRGRKCLVNFLGREAKIRVKLRLTSLNEAEVQKDTVLWSEKGRRSPYNIFRLRLR